MTEHSQGPHSSTWAGRAAGIAIALAAGAITVLIRRDVATLAPAGQMPGLLEGVAIAIARNARDTPIGGWLHVLNMAGVAAVVAAFVPLGAISANRWLGVAAALALGLTAPFGPLLAPPDTFVIAAVALSLVSMVHEPRSWRTALLAILAAALAPALAPAYAALWLLSRGPRTSSRQLAVVPLMFAAACLPLVLPALPPSVGADTPWRPLEFLARAGHHVWSTGLAPAGPYALALALLAGLGGRHLFPPGTRLAVTAFVAAGALASGVPQVQPLRALAPLVVVLWMFVAAGLGILVRECRRNIGGYIAAALLVVLLPGLQALRASPEAERLPLGHDTLTPAAFRRLVAAMPDGAVVVREDASIDMLWRATGRTWQRSGKRLHVADIASPQLVQLADRTRPPLVFALPSAQLALQHLGFMLAEAPPPQAAGVAGVSWNGTPCAVLSQSWEDVSSVAALQTLSMVADDEKSRGTVEIRAASTDRLEPRQINWSAYAAPGFAVERYDGDNPEHRDNLAADLEDAQVPADARLTGASYNVSLTMWRRPDAARMLMIDLGGRPSFTLARYSPGETQQLRLCPAFPYTPVAVGR